jgi:predicted neutral ceramidase superfamily lipid hydrolase
VRLNTHEFLFINHPLYVGSFSFQYVIGVLHVHHLSLHCFVVRAIRSLSLVYFLSLFFFFFFFFLMTRNPSKAYFVYLPLTGKPRTHVELLLHTNRVILRLCWRAGPKELFAFKGIRTLDLMRLPQRPRSFVFSLFGVH